MRAGPIGLLADHDRVLRTAAVQARITHDTRDEAGAWIAQHVEGRWADL